MKQSRLLCMLFAVLMLLCLTACGGDKPKNAGTEPEVLKLDSYELLYKGAKIMKDADGKDALVLTMDFTNHSEANCSYIWSIIETAMQNGKELEFATVLTAPDTFDTVTDSQLTQIEPGETLQVQTAFVLADTTSEVEITFEEILGTKTAKLTVDPSELDREATAAGETAAVAAPAASDDILLQWWNGDWYGWWVMSDCAGYYEDMEGDWWDLCGTIDIGKNYTGTVILWDEDYTKSAPMAFVLVSLSESGTGKHGTMTTESGDFTDVALHHGDWIVDPGLVEYENTIHIDGDYKNGEDAFHYDIILRPWGTYWDDMDTEELPYYYDDWYLPLIEADKAMPDSIEVELENGSA